MSEKQVCEGCGEEIPGYVPDLVMFRPESASVDLYHLACSEKAAQDALAAGEVGVLFARTPQPERN